MGHPDSRMEVDMKLNANAQLALDTIRGKPVQGIPSWCLFLMEHGMIERLADAPPGSYAAAPETTYLAMQRRAGICMIDQYIPTNPLTIGSSGYDSDKPRTATTGLDQIVLDGITIDSPEAVIEHMEKIVFPKKQASLEKIKTDPDYVPKTLKMMQDKEGRIQEEFGGDILKAPYNAVSFPRLGYNQYGYENYFMAYALYPEAMEKGFALDADIAVIVNRAMAHAFVAGNLPPLNRMDFDMADSRGTLVDIKSLDKLWFPHFARAIEPMLKTDVKLIWHCDGNLMQMVPRLLECGLRGFQGFQYEDGMDYEKICRMKTRDGDNLFIIAGVSVTRTLPMGKPDDVKKEMQWLVAHGPQTGLFLGVSSSVAPGVPWENLKTLVEGFEHYRNHGR